MKILTHQSCIVSAKLLRDHLAVLLGHDILVTTNADKVRGPFIRYGNGDPVATSDTAFNSAEFVKLVSHKSAFSQLLAQHQIATPTFYRRAAPQQYPILIRQTLNSSGGRGIIVCPDKATFDQNWDPAYVWTPFIPTQFELRVHVIGGKVVKVFKKVYRPDLALDNENETDDGRPDAQEPALPIRNLDKGYHYKVRRLETYPKVHELVAALDPHLGGKFYTLDLGWDTVNKRYFVFEANSGSGLNSQTVELYADYLAREVLA
jgi:glutathione synthase/RimK-type ligase-like ATP-grasp enzyme